MIELIVVITVAGILASAFGGMFVPIMNFFFYYPESSRVNNAASDVLQIVLEGDHKAKGLRFAGPPCVVPSGGSDTITAASATSITYHYSLPDECLSGGTAGHQVKITYVAADHEVTREIDGGSAVEIPDYATSTSGIKIDPSAGVNFFRYYDSADTELSSTPAVADIDRVDITVNATSGSGQVRHGAGQILLKSGVEVKRHTT